VNIANACSTNYSADDYSAVVLSTETEIRQLRDYARRLMQQDDTMLDPEFFLASVYKGWAPRVVTVRKSGDLAGIMYAKERIISGVPTGIVYADGSLGGMFVGTPLHQQDAIRCAVETLFSFPGTRGVRLRVLQGSIELEAVRQLAASKSLDVRYTPLEHDDSPLWKYHAHLALADTYDQFLKRLGSTTRHNFRYYRRRFEAAGHKFVENLSVDQLTSVALELGPKSKYASSVRQMFIERDLKFVAATTRPLAVGLKHHSGEWLSIIGGWYRPGGAVLCFQCNNECDFGSDSLSIVLRAYLIEHLIRQGLEELVIWDDTRPPLSRYVTYAPTVGIRLDVPTLSWRVARSLISTLTPHLPRRLAAAAQWIS
jgi:hypothetical protein